MKRASSVLRLAAALVLVSALVSACGGADIAQPKPLIKLPSPAYRMQTLWRVNAGDGAGPYIRGFEPAVTHDRIYVANRDGTVVDIDLDSGKKVWRTDTGDALVSGPAVAAGVVLVGTRNGEVVALSADRGKRMWATDLSSAVLAPVGVSKQIAVARTLDGHLVGLDIQSGKQLWTVESTEPKLTVRGTSSPQIVGNTVYAGMDNGKVLALDLAAGEQRWQQVVALPSGRSELDRIVDIDANPLIVGNSLYAVSVGGQMAALSPITGRVRWNHKVASETGLAADGNHVYTTDSDGVVWAIDRATGKTVWSQKALEHRRLSAPALYRGDLLVGDYDGYLHWLSSDDGSEIARGRPFDEAIRAQPVIAGDRIIVLGADGEVAAVKFVTAGS